MPCSVELKDFLNEFNTRSKGLGTLSRTHSVIGFWRKRHDKSPSAITSKFYKVQKLSKPISNTQAT